MDNVDNLLSGIQKLNKTTLNKKQKTINITAKEAFMEGNLIEIPFITCTKSKELVTGINYNWIDSQNNNHSIEIIGGKYGIPTILEYDVLVALLRIFAKNNKITHGQIDSVNNDLKIHFSLNDLAKEMGYTRVSGRITNRIKQSIIMLQQTNFTNDYSGILYDIKTQQYITTSKRGYSILVDFNFYEFKNNPKATQKDLNYATLHSFFYDSIKNNYFKYFNYNIYQELQSGIAKRIFLCLTKWKNKKSFVSLKYTTLYDRIPLEESMPNHQKKASVKRASEALIKVGFINSFNMDKETISYNFNNKKQL